MFNLLIACVFFSYFFCDAMSSDEKMKKITNWEDVKQFAGKVVVYQAKSYYFAGDTHRLNNQLNVGFVEKAPSPWNSDENGYNMNKLLIKDGVPGNCALTNSLIAKRENGSLLMRESTEQERKEILKALNDKKAEFAYMFFYEKKLRKILNQ